MIVRNLTLKGHQALTLSTLVASSGWTLSRWRMGSPSQHVSFPTTGSTWLGKQLFWKRKQLWRKHHDVQLDTYLDPAVVAEGCLHISWDYNWARWPQHLQYQQFNLLSKWNVSKWHWYGAMVPWWLSSWAESSTVIATGWVVDYIQSVPGHHRPDRFLVVVSANWGINQAVAVT